MIELLERASKQPLRRAIVDPQGSYSFEQLLSRSTQFAGYLSHHTSAEFPMAFMVSPGFHYVATLWAIWQLGAIAVPLCPHHPEPALKHVLQDTGCRRVIVDHHYRDRCHTLCSKLGLTMIDPLSAEAVIPSETNGHSRAEALILYTSGSTSLPKGVVITHHNLEAQMRSLSRAWEWSHEDVILNVLPMHHVHGLVNILCCALWNGATCIFHQEFSVEEVVAEFLKGEVNVFMAVPTIYFKLIQHYGHLDESIKAQLSARMGEFRLMVSGSAALPMELLQSWEKISGQVLLERYGMTEIGMALSNPYRGTRYPGLVGWPLPSVSVKLVDTETQREVREQGELWVKGPSVFQQYWKQPEVTRDSFQDQWFKTGDIAEKTKHGYRILGRKNVDIIKSGGYKISALEIENVLLKHAAILECAVVGLPDPEWGEIVAAALVASNTPLDLQELETLVLQYLPGYKKPRKYFLVKELPRNALGKVIKPKLKEILADRV